MLHWLLLILWEENLHQNYWVSLPADSYIVISFGIMLDHFSIVGETVNCCVVCLWRRLDCSVNNCTKSPPVISVTVLVTDSKLSVLTFVCHFIFYLFCTTDLFFPSQWSLLSVLLLLSLPVPVSLSILRAAVRVN
jgi:hypothetical protein